MHHLDQRESLTALILVNKQQNACFLKRDVILQLVNLHELIDENRVESVGRTVSYFIVNLVLERLDKYRLDQNLSTIPRCRN